MSEPFKRYQCHKKVEAFKIVAIKNCAPEGEESDGSRLLVGELTRDSVGWHVEHDWMRKHKPEVGGYVVRYADGYLSYSPAKAFEEGYTEILE